ncbi:MAG TPA: hypothetical protein VK507_05470 [Iamia sp.]|nr:hypothetical protein [Iamia sp.]
MPHPTCTVARPLPHAALDQIARQLAEAHAGTTHATLVRIRPGPAGVDIGLCALPDGVHPADALIGHVVPPAWAASGVVAAARARPVDEPDHPGTPTTVVVLVGRDGRLASHSVGVDGPETRGEQPVGRLPDLLRRSLGLPTAPPDTPAAEWWRVCWLDALVAAAAADPTHRPDPARPLTSTLPPDLVQALVDEPGLCGVEGWSRIRLLAAEPEAPSAPGPAAVRRAVAPYVEPPRAAWMDDGCFSRWLLGAVPALDELLDLATALLPPEVVDVLRPVALGHPPDPEGEPAPHPVRGPADAPR